MAGWLTNDITRLTGIINDACDKVECADCMFRIYTSCPEEIIHDLNVSVANLRGALTRCENMLKEQL